MNTRLLMTLYVNVAAPQNIGAVAHGTRRTAPLTGGHFEGPRLRGTVLADGSADWLLLRADGVLELDLRATLRTDDGALISMKSFGVRHGPPDVIAGSDEARSSIPRASHQQARWRSRGARPCPCPCPWRNHEIRFAKGPNA
jgi:hypothetical protein